jgi:hypothetical protein
MIIILTPQSSIGLNTNKMTKPKEIIERHELFNIQKDQADDIRLVLRQNIREKKTFMEIAERFELSGKQEFTAYELGWFMAMDKIERDTKRQLSGLEGALGNVLGRNKE